MRGPVTRRREWNQFIQFRWASTKVISIEKKEGVDQVIQFRSASTKVISIEKTQAGYMDKEPNAEPQILHLMLILQLSIDHPWQLRLEFINHYAIRQLPQKQKGFFIMLENSLVALAATPFVLIVFNCFCCIYLLFCFFVFSLKCFEHILLI